jgi:hypothetical protein
MKQEGAVTPISVRAYARRRKAAGLPGGSLAAVQQAIGAGRISLRPDGLIDPAAADHAWTLHTDAAKARHVNGTNGHTSVSLVEARTREAIERGRGLQLANDLRAGQLIPLEAAKRIMAGRVLEARNGWLALVSKLRLHLPHLSGDDLAVIDRLIRETLEAMADGRLSQSTITPAQEAPT